LSQGSFGKDYIKTVVAPFSTLDREIEGDWVRLFFWNSAGVNEFHYLRPTFINNSKAAIIIYSLEDNDLGRESFNHIPDWSKIVRHNCGDIPIYIFANKVDLIDTEEVDVDKIRKIVDENNFSGYFITSAETGQGVIEGFDVIRIKLYNIYKAKSPPEPLEL